VTISGIHIDEALESDLLERAQRMQPAALAEIHDRYYPVVYRYVRYRLADEHSSEDISADVFLRLLDAFNRGRGPDRNLRGWLLGTASNLVNDSLRRRYRRPVENLDEEVENNVVGDLSPEHSLEGKQQHMQVRQALKRLTGEQQHVLSLRFANEFSLEETARLVGKTVTAVKALQFRALASLKRFMDEEARTNDGRQS
jgi:RNA polymerase sigma-70 factor (ECF subfamily)